MDYHTYTPGQLLSTSVKCYWSLEMPASAETEKQRIIPDGCMELIVHYGDQYRQYLPDGSQVIQPRSFVFGQLTEPLDIEPTGTTGMIAARFFPDGFSAFCSTPPSTMQNRAVSLTELFGAEGEELEKNVLAASGHPARIACIEAFLSTRLNLPQGLDYIAKSSVALLLQTGGQLSTEEMAGQLQVNRRQLERKFSAAIGLSPKQLSKMIRLQTTLKSLDEQQFSSLTELAHANGYFDQAHFIKDFKEFTGLSPKQFYAGSLKFSALFRQ